MLLRLLNCICKVLLVLLLGEVQATFEFESGGILFLGQYLLEIEIFYGCGRLLDVGPGLS